MIVFIFALHVKTHIEPWNAHDCYYCALTKVTLH